jgi:hypothetical protein
MTGRSFLVKWVGPTKQTARFPVIISRIGTLVWVRDTGDLLESDNGRDLVLTEEQWTDFIAAVKRGDYDETLEAY